MCFLATVPLILVIDVLTLNLTACISPVTSLHPSAFLSSVIPHSVAISVGKTKKPFADGFTDGICAPKKKDSRLKYTDGFLFRR
jgi:hypothetical protein